MAYLDEEKQSDSMRMLREPDGGTSVHMCQVQATDARLGKDHRPRHGVPAQVHRVFCVVEIPHHEGMFELNKMEVERMARGENLCADVGYADAQTTGPVPEGVTGSSGTCAAGAPTSRKNREVSVAAKLEGVEK